MRKTLNINLGGMAFIIDENAFELLHNYLEALKQKFNNAAERDEIMSDIENRIAEMLGKKLAGTKEVLSVDDVQQVMDVMGRPEDIAGDDAEETTTTSTTSANATTNTTTSAPVHKKLFRDIDDSKIGGVISGLCHYFGIKDPAWIRVAAIVLIVLTKGLIILAYLLLLVVVPKAVTAAEKLQMKGEPVNISTIEREIKEAASRATDSVHKFVGDQNFFEKLWDIFVSVFKTVWKIVAAIIIVVGLFILLILLLGIFGISYAGNTAITQAPSLLVDSSFNVRIFEIGVFLLIGVPVIAIIYGFTRLIVSSKQETMPWFKWALLGLWWVGVILVGITAYHTGMDFKSTATKKNEYALMQPTGNLYVQLTDSTGNKLSEDDDEERGFNVTPSGIFINGVSLDEIQLIDIGKPSLQLMPSPNDSFYVQEAISSQGRNKNDALKNADNVIYKFSQRDSVLNLPYNAYLSKTNKWRSQDMVVRIEIPAGKYVHFSENIDRWAATVKGDSHYDDTEFAHTIWTVEKGKVVCVGGENHKSEEKTSKKDRSTDTKDGDNSDDDKSEKDKDY